MGEAGLEPATSGLLARRSSLLSYSPEMGWHGRIRTCIPSVNSRVHYLPCGLCYMPMWPPSQGLNLVASLQRWSLPKSSSEGPRGWVRASVFRPQVPALYCELPRDAERRLSRIREDLSSWVGCQGIEPCGPSGDRVTAGPVSIAD